MRTIKFRGKSVDYGTWRYGSLIIHGDGSMAITGGANEFSSQLWSSQVHPESVGQWTGLVDRHGKEIYEGDIVKCVSRLDMAHMIVLFEEGEFRMVLCEDYDSYTTGMGFYAIRCFEKEVIGNVFDNGGLYDR